MEKTVCTQTLRSVTDVIAPMYNMCKTTEEREDFLLVLHTICDAIAMKLRNEWPSHAAYTSSVN